MRRAYVCSWVCVYVNGGVYVKYENVVLAHTLCVREKKYLHTHANTHTRTRARAHTRTHTKTHTYTAYVCVWVHCNTLQDTARHYKTLQHTATHCNTLQHTATHCNTLQHTATHCTEILMGERYGRISHANSHLCSCLWSNS